MTEKTKKKNSSTLILLLVVFGLPVILAKLALDNNWFNKAATNRGELLDPILNFSEIDKRQSHKWRVMYVLPSNCLQTCENALYSLSQIWVATGKESDRVEPVVVVTESSNAEKIQQLDGHEIINTLTTDDQTVNKVFKDASTDGIFLIDTLDNVILRYPLNIEKQQAVMQSRDILADIRKLLKLSRIG